MKHISFRTCAAFVFILPVLFSTLPARAQIGIDAKAVKNQSSPSKTVTTAAFSTKSANELLLAFISTDSTTSPNTSVSSVSGAGLTWVLVQRTNVQKGTAEIWRAFAANTLTNVTVAATLSQSVDSSMTVLSFSGVNASGTNGSGAVGATGTFNNSSGAPTGSVITQGNGSLVLGVGDDWDNGISRTLGSNQTLVNQYLAPVGDTYWVQMQTNAIPLSGTSVTINDTAPTTDRYNLSIVEVLSATGSTGTTFTISGTISPASAGTGTTVALTQGATTIATTSATGGSYTFSNISPGTYTVTPTNGADSFSPANQTAVVSSSNVTVPVFNATALTYSVSGTINPASAGTGTTVELTQGATTIATTSASGGTYTFSNISPGTYTVTPTNSADSFSPANQTAIVSTSNVTVPVFNAAALSYTVSGTISPSPAGPGTSVALLQGTTAIATVSATSGGTYSFPNVLPGSYTVTPTNSSYTFSPLNQPATVSNANVAVPVFTATPVPTFNVSGTINPSTAGTGTTLTLTLGSTTIASVSATSSGTYNFSNIPNGTYNVTPTSTGYTFSPNVQSVTVSGADSTVPVFNATAATTWSISGTLTPLASGTAASVVLSQNGATVASVSGDSNGQYVFSNLNNGVYTITPSKTGYSFTPLTQTVTVSGANLTAANMVGTAINGTLLYPDLSDIIPTNDISVVGTGSSRTFQYTHDTYNGGPGPLVIQPTYNPASGTYQGTQYIYTQNSAGTWTLSQTVRLAGAFIFDASHGHFHYPFTTYGLYTVAADGTPGTPVAISGKVEFCIDDSFIYSPSLPNAGALGNLGSCSDPTSLRGLDIGAVDEYDQTDAGQSISIASLPDGNYWLRAIADPFNYLSEASKANNETDVEVSITGGSLTVLKSVTPVLPPPPSISINSPADGSTVSGTVQLVASTGTTTGVQFLIDGTPLGSLITAPPFTFAWDSTSAINGTHWLAAQTTSATGQYGTSAVIAVTVSNISGTPPTVQITTPTSGATVSAAVTLNATAASNVGIANVTFFVDGTQVGSPVTAPPYLTSWDTETFSAGQHSITATATDTTGNSATSTAVVVTVDNSHPPNIIGQDVTVSVNGTGRLTAPSFSTSVDGELILAFVAFDGPSGSLQTATVSGGGLTWSLVMRSNHQSGTAEIWMAYASDAPFTVSAVSATPGGSNNYHGSMTLIAFTNASGPGIVGQTSAPTGAPDIFLPGVSAGNWVFAVGNDWDRAVARTPVAGQLLVHQDLDTNVGDTYWVQSTTAPAAGYGLVDIHDSAPTNDQWNYAAVEVVATRQP